MSRKNLANPTSLGTVKIIRDMMEKRRRVIGQKIDKYKELDEDDADV